MSASPNRLENLPAGFQVVDAGEVDSSNDDAKRRAQAGASDGTVIWARAQITGRGRQGRNWRSPPGNLYMSIISRPACRPAEAPQLGFVTTLAVADAIAPLLPSSSPVSLKWPNDILVGGAKAGGVLLESAITAPAPTIDWLVIGIGLNLRSHPEDTPYPATDLLTAGGRDTNPADALAAVLRAFRIWSERWQSDGFGPVRAAWLDRAHGLRQKIEVRQGVEPLTGTFAGLDEAGALLLDRPDGRRLPIHLGDVFPVTE